MQCQVGTLQHEPLVDELEHLHLVPLRGFERDVPGTRRGRGSDDHTVHQPRGPARREPSRGLLGFHRAVERDAEQLVHQLGAHAGDRVGERTRIGDPGVLGVQAATQVLQRTPRPAVLVDELGLGQRGELAAARQPVAQLRGHRRVLQHPDAVEVLEVVDGVGDVVGEIHHRRLHRLLPVLDPVGERRAALLQLVQLSGVDGELGRARAGGLGRFGGAARGHGQCGRVGARPVQARPRVLQQRRPDRRREVQTAGHRAAHLGGGDDPERLRVALEAVGQPVPVSGDAVEHLLAEVAERRVSEVVAECRGLRHVGVASAELGDERTRVLGGGDAFGDQSSHLGDLETVGESVVQQCRAARADHLRDSAQAGEEGRGDQPVAVGPERAGRQRGESRLRRFVPPPGAGVGGRYHAHHVPHRT